MTEKKTYGFWFNRRQARTFRDMALTATIVTLRSKVDRVRDAVDDADQAEALNKLSQQASRLNVFHKDFQLTLDTLMKSDKPDMKLTIDETYYRFMVSVVNLREIGPDSPAMQKVCIDMGINPADYRAIIDDIKKALAGAVVIEPPPSDAPTMPAPGLIQ